MYVKFPHYVCLPSSAHKMELLNETQQLSKRLQKTQSELRRQVEAASTTSYHFTKAQQDLASVVDAHLNTFLNFDQAVCVCW